MDKINIKNLNDIKDIRDIIKITKIREYEIIFRFKDIWNTIELENGNKICKEYLCLVHENSSNNDYKDFYIKEINIVKDKNNKKYIKLDPNINKFQYIKTIKIYKSLLDYFLKKIKLLLEHTII